MKGSHKRWRSSLQALLRPTAGLWLGCLMIWGALLPETAQGAVQLNDYCQISQADASRKEALRRAAFENNDAQAKSQYEALVAEHAQALNQCRAANWPREQAVWLRLYPCDLQPGILEAVLDRIANLGYNQVYAEAFYSGMVLLPKADNPTVWPSVVQAAGYERRDLLAEAIAKAPPRGLETYAWVFSLNFGYTYTLEAQQRDNLAVNGQGQDTYAFAQNGLSSNAQEVFVDPYSLEAQQHFQVMLSEVVERRPQGVLFDYIRYPRGTGSYSVASNVADLWIYGDASRNALLRRATNAQGLELIRRYISRGHLLQSDLTDVGRLYPNDSEPLWQSRLPGGDNEPSSLLPTLQNELWRLSVAHAVQGVVDYLTESGQLAQQQGLRTGAVFFPRGNQVVGNGFDSRLQYWDRFPTWMSWHPMAYGVCGHTGCILDEIRRVMASAGPQGAQFVKPAIAGAWGQSFRDRPSLETQMQAIRQAIPEINSVSHFAYSWQDPEFDNARKFCELR
ncbi:MAG: family 10 glycosylhydrolase [Leptolyngbya sp. SIOISBB]|nr:family 10 glycosylhydrolase [Leptolyngbya sp. SIOISBB]